MSIEKRRYQVALSEGSLAKLNQLHSQPEYNHHISTSDLDYPCNDRSSGVQDFSQWSYFKRNRTTLQSEFLTHSSTWTRPLLEKIKDQLDYDQKIKSWNPMEPPKKVRIEKSARMLEKLKLKTEREFAARKKPKQGREVEARVNMKTPVIHSRVAASDGGGSYPLVGAVSGTLKLPSVPPKKRLRRKP